MTHNSLAALAQLYEIVLGSGSPRRVKLLKECGIPFTQLIPNIEEVILPHENPHDFALRMSFQKGRDIANRLSDNQLAICCDTIVILEDKVLRKPKDENDAFQILRSLSGKSHEVATSIALFQKNQLLANDLETTTVYFNTVTPEQIREYIATKEPMDKAGAYGIQGMGAFLVDRIDGNLDNVIGFPRELFIKLAEQILK